MRKNDDLKENKGGSLTRRTMLKATLGLGAMASTGSWVAYASGSDTPSKSPSGGHSGKTANWYNGFIFQDESLVFEFIRVMSKSVEHGADIGESLAAAYRIKQKEGDQQALLQAWYEEWRKLGERIEKIGDECLEKGHPVSARDAYFRASEYYRSADFYLHDHPENPAILQLWNKMDSCFEKARKLSVPSFEAVRIPYEGTKLPAYFCPAGKKGKRAPTILIHQGFDGTIQETYLLYGKDAVRRGYNCLIFEGPGQGSVIRKQGLPFRHDWEKVVTPVVDYALQRKEVDPKRMALIGLSMGGYLAPRAAVYEHRLAALVANSGILDNWAQTYERLGMKREELIKFIEDKPGEFNAMAREASKASITVHWGLTNGLFTFAAKTPAELSLQQAKMTLADTAHLISCPTLVIDSDAEQFFGGQPKKLYDALKCPKTYLIFKSGEGAELHCQSGGQLLGNQRIFDWLDETLNV
ncbi:MAG TPA: prolyl oligopeptidase family serine peptidase [Smithellaceae bacterium]|nr:prolyl oligopeptidase family serine peptidase [Smithellaceae bacterium]